MFNLPAKTVNLTIDINSMLKTVNATINKYVKPNVTAPNNTNGTNSSRPSNGTNNTNASGASNATPSLNLSSDPYQIALLILTLGNAGRFNDSQYFVPYLLQHQTKSGAFNAPTNATLYSLTNTLGNDLVVETTALAVIALFSSN
jgi:hypothetical protein